MKLISDRIWRAVCSGDINTLEKLSAYWKNKKVVRLAFGVKHSLIMGALRNKEYKTVCYLIENEETIFPHEINELLKDFKNVLDDLLIDTEQEREMPYNEKTNI